jgi:D-lactate dehydrogenase
MRVLFYSIHSYDKSPIENANSGKHEIQFTELQLNEETVSLAAGFDAVSLFTSDSASELVLEKLLQIGIRFIALRSVGFDNVSLKKANSLSIKVANVPAYSPYSVAEHAVALLLAVNRKLLLGQQLIQHQDYRLQHLTGFDINGKTVGIIGTGKIGSAFASIMKGFGCNLIAFDPIEDPILKAKLGIRYTTLEEVCHKSDILSLHCPLNVHTKYMINELIFEQMKKGVILLNTARGGIINTNHLLAALANNTVGALGLDVYENEKNIFGKDLTALPLTDDLFIKLRSYPNVLITGHQAFLTTEALEGIAAATIATINSWANGEKAINELE